MEMKCWNGKKIAYITERAAFDARKKMKKDIGNRTLRPYLCPYCKNYHLTHHKQKKHGN